MQVQVSPEINGILDAAVGISVQRGQFFVGVEHLFEALLAESSRLPKSVTDHYLTVLYTAIREVTREAWRDPVRAATGEVFYTPRCANILNDTAKLAERFRTQAGAGHLLLAVLADPDAAPSRAMDRLQLNRGKLIQVLQHELAGQGQPSKLPSVAGKVAAQAKTETASAAAPASAVLRPEDDPDAKSPPPPIESFTHDLTEAARAGKLSRAVGRDAEIFEILQILARKTKNNVIIVGEAGVGKTKVVEGLAVEAVQGGFGGILSDHRILELNLSALMAGTQYRGAFEEKVLGLVQELKQSPQTILFVDEIHLIMGAGATDGSSVDFANLLKPALSRGEIRCIGATTLEEYRKFIEKDPAIERRFQMLRVEELSAEATQEVLLALRPPLEKHHGVHIGSKAMQAAIALSERYLPNRKLPDKAIDVLDQACARYRLKSIALQSNPALVDGTVLPSAVDKVTPHDIRRVISQMTGVPIEEMTDEERQKLRNLGIRLKERLIGQDEAVATVVSAIKKSRAGLGDPNRPEAVMLFLGPTGVGKTELAKLLGDVLFGSTNHLLTFDMSEYVESHSVSRLLGAPPGYAGCEEEGLLSKAVRGVPQSVLLFDEIEKAHSQIFDIFLPIFDEGRLKDSQGREITFKNCIIILTTNVGADWVFRSSSNDDRRALMDELREHFRPEFINRIDHVVPFYPLMFEDVRSILRIYINELRHRLKEKRMGVRMYQEAYEYLAKEGYSAEFGARELRRAVERLVVSPISEMILEDKFHPGDMIDVLMESDVLTFGKGAPHRAKTKEAVGDR